jgi:hypothetical protein
MDPITALSVVAAVIQFLDYGTRIVSKGKELYSSADGALSENMELETASVQLQNLSNTLMDSFQAGLKAPPGGKPDQSDEVMQKICEDCVAVSRELVEQLEKLKIPEGHPHKKWKSFRQALKAVWTKEKINEIAERLKNLRNYLDTVILVSVR